MEPLYNTTFGNVADANRKAVDTIANFNRIAMRAQSQLAEKQLLAFEKCVEASTRHFQIASETRDPKEFVSRQAEVAVALGETLMGVAREAMDIQVQARDEFTSWVSEGLNSVDEPVPAKPKAPKKAPA